VTPFDPTSSGLGGTNKTHRPLLSISIVVVIILATVPPSAAQLVCSVPGTHSSIQSAVNDRQCAIISLSVQTYRESVQIFRTVEIGAPPQRAVIEGLLSVIEPGT